MKKALKTHVIKNDVVKVLVGKYKNKIGQVLQVLPQINKVVVSGVNIKKKILVKKRNEVVKMKNKRKNSNEQFYKTQKSIEMPIHISNVALYSKELNSTIKKIKRNKKTGHLMKKEKIKNQDLTVS